eukprot:g37795.t1
MEPGTNRLFRAEHQEERTNSVPPQRMLQLAVQAAEALRPPEEAEETETNADQPSDGKDPPATASQPLDSRRSRPPRTKRRITKVSRMLKALQSVQKCIQRGVPRDPGNRILPFGKDIYRTLYLKGTVVTGILAEMPSDSPLDLEAELPRAFKEVAEVCMRISRAQEDLDTEHRLAKLPRRKILNQIFDRKLFKLYLLGATPRTALNPTLRESEADIQTSEAQALQEEVRRLIQDQKDQEAPALRAYLTRFRQRDEIFPDRNTDEAKRLQDQGIDAKLDFTAPPPPVDILPELLEYLETHEPDLFLLNIPRSEEDQWRFCLKLRTTASEHSSSTKDNA